MVKKIAITGGIGSGKSAVLKILNEEGFPTFSCDEIYKEILFDKEYIRLISLTFPTAVKNDNIDKKVLAEIVFSDKNKREELDSIAHPMIMKKLFEKISQIDNGIVFVEVPLLFECGYTNMFDGVIVVQRSSEERIQSVMKRDGLDEGSVLARMNAQFDYSIFDENYNADKNIRILYNDQSIEKLKENIKNIIIKIS